MRKRALAPIKACTYLLSYLARALPPRAQVDHRVIARTNYGAIEAIRDQKVIIIAGKERTMSYQPDREMAENAIVASAIGVPLNYQGVHRCDRRKCDVGRA